MNWYQKSMPQIKDVKEFVQNICTELGKISGVKNIIIHGSYAANINKPDYIIKDIDIIANTNFDSGDLLAIDNSRYSALKINPADLEDEGFNPDAVSFTKKFLSYKNYNIDHWAAAKDGQLLHWGATPESKEEWEELHSLAEKEAQRQTGFSRKQLLTATSSKRNDWKLAYDDYTKLYLKSANNGWCLSNIKLDKIKEKIII